MEPLQTTHRAGAPIRTRKGGSGRGAAMVETALSSLLFLGLLTLFLHTALFMADYAGLQEILTTTSRKMTVVPIALLNDRENHARQLLTQYAQPLGVPVRPNSVRMCISVDAACIRGLPPTITQPTSESLMTLSATIPFSFLGQQVAEFRLHTTTFNERF